MTLKEFFLKIGLDVDSQAFAKGQLLANAIGTALEFVRDMAFEVSGALLDTAHESANLERLAQIANMSTMALQELGYAAEQSGLGGLEEMEDHLAQLSERVGQAAEGTGEAAVAFKNLGINVKQSNGKLKDLDTVFFELADKISAMPDSTEKTANIVGIFGDAGAKLVPLLNQGADGLERFRQEAHDLGRVLDDETVIANAEAGRELAKFESVLKGVKQTLASEVLPALTAGIKVLVEWWRASREIIKLRFQQIIRMLGLVLKPVLFAFRMLAKVLGFINDNFGAIAAIVGGILLAVLLTNLATVWGLVAGYIAAGAAGVASGLAAAAAWLLANAGIIALAVLLGLAILLIEDLYTWWQGGDSVLGGLWEKWKGFIKDWLEPKDDDHWLLAAFKAVIRTIASIGEIWDSIVEGMRQAWDAFVDTVTLGLSSLDWDWTGNEGDIKHAGNTARIEAMKARFSAAAASPTSSAAASSSTKVLAPQFKAEFKIQAMEGQDPSDIAMKMRDAMDHWFDGKMREAREGT